MSQRIGAHTVEVEGDLLKLTIHGAFSLEDMKQVTDFAEVHGAPFGYLLILNDLTEAAGLSAEARRYSAERVREAKKHGPVYAASASYGVGPLMRGLAALYFAMLRLLTDGAQTSLMAKSEAEARAFLEERRRHFQSQVAAAKAR